jgi:hypothetical protein
MAKCLFVQIKLPTIFKNVHELQTIDKTSFFSGVYLKRERNICYPDENILLKDMYLFTCIQSMK